MNERVSGKPSGLAGRLVIEGLIDADQASKAQAAASDSKVPFVRYLVDEVKVDSRRLVEIASQEFGAPRFDITAFDAQFLPQGLVEPDLVTKHHALPLYSRGKRLFIAVSDPTNLAALDEMKFHTGLNTEAILVDERDLQRAIAAWSEDQDDIAGGLEDLESDEFDDIDVSAVDEDRKEGEEDDQRGRRHADRPLRQQGTGRRHQAGRLRHPLRAL
jgi:type IV pilus assembly protein PilB